MYIIIMGAGRVGSRLAKVLALEGHEIMVIDKDEKAFARLGDSKRIKTVEGIGFDIEVLKQAGIERADAFIAVTNGDNSNIVASLIAKNRFRVPKVFARIYDPLKEKLYQTFGLQTISSTSWAANKIKDMLLHAEVVRHMSFGNGEVEILEAEIFPQLAGKRVADLTVPGEIDVICIIRYGRSFVPTSGTVLEEKDGIAFSVVNTAIPTLKRMLHLA
jgi:trk system potassium uptake protein TrkA